MQHVYNSTQHIIVQRVKNWFRGQRICLQCRRTPVQSLGLENPLEKEVEAYSSILTWGIPWTEEPGRLQSMGSQSQTRLTDYYFNFFHIINIIHILDIFLFLNLISRRHFALQEVSLTLSHTHTLSAPSVSSTFLDLFHEHKNIFWYSSIF